MQNENDTFASTITYAKRRANYEGPNCIRPLNLRTISPQIVHPNTQLCDKNWKAKEFGSPSVKQTASRPSTEEASSEEYFDPCDIIKPAPVPSRISTFQQSRRDITVALDPLTSASFFDFDPAIITHMTEPLLPDTAPLDFSPIANMRWETNVFSATPLARVREFNTSVDTNECSLMNILADEIESITVADAEHKPTLWETLRRHTVGLSEEEYDRHYPWAKYGCGEAQSPAGESDQEKSED